MQKLTRLACCICLATACGCWPVQANGFRLASHDAEASARGEAFAATADNPSAIYYNPAGIGFLPGHNARLGVYAISLGFEYDPPAGGAGSDSDNDMAVVPDFFYSFGPESLPLAFGLGVYAPFGLANHWPETTGFRSIALDSEMTYLTVNPVIAWKVLTNLSIAVGPTFNWSEIELKNGLTPIPNNDLSTLQGDGLAYGFNAGLIWQPHPKLSLGAVYRSKTEVEYDGSTEIAFYGVTPPGYPPSLNMNAKAKVPTPMSVVGGISYRPTPKWNLEIDVDWTDWEQVGTIKVEQMIPATLALKWQSSFYYEFGITRYFGEGWHVSAGYIYNENSVPDKTFNPWVPDQNRHFGTFGLGYQGKHFNFDAAYQFGYGPDRTVTGSPISAAGESADGNYGYLSHGISVTAGLRF